LFFLEGVAVVYCDLFWELAMCLDAAGTVAARSKAWTVFARSNAGIVGSNSSQGMDVCV
jgi:hypothetical protein